jgi:outer membrane protein
MTFRQLTLAAVTALLFALPATAQDKLKIATVDMQTLFKQYHRTTDAQREVNVERAKIQQNNNDRLETIRALEGELQGLRKQLDDPSLSDKRKQELFKDFQMKTQEGVALDRERREFLQRRNTALNEKMMQKMRGILEEIRKLVEDRAKSDDYDYVFDKSGMSTSQVPFLLYTKDATDITAGLLGVLNKDAPAPTPEAGK